MTVRRHCLLLGLLTSIGACSALGGIFKEPNVQLDRVVVRGVGRVPLTRLVGYLTIPGYSQ